MYGKIAMVGDILILLHMEYNTSNQNLLTRNPQYFQGCITLRFAPLATGPNFGSSDFTGSLRGQSELNGMSSDPHKGVNSLDLIWICLD